MSYMFQPKTCRFMLYGPFIEIITNQLQNLTFDPIDGVRLSFQCSGDECHRPVVIEIDPEGSISKLSVIEPTIHTAEMIFDFSNDELIFYGDSLELIVGHSIFHMLQQTIASHYQAGHYSVTATAL